MLQFSREIPDSTCRAWTFIHVSDRFELGLNCGEPLYVTSNKTADKNSRQIRFLFSNSGSSDVVSRCSRTKLRDLSSVKAAVSGFGVHGEKTQSSPLCVVTTVTS